MEEAATADHSHAAVKDEGVRPPAERRRAAEGHQAQRRWGTPYEVKKTANGKFVFNLKAGNNEVILSSEAYNDKSSVLAGIESVRKNGTDDANFEMKKSAAGQPYFVLKAANKQVIGKSEMYSSEAAAEGGIAAVKKNCKSPDVKELE